MIEEVFKQTLKMNNYYVTPERICIFQILKDKKTPCSLTELIKLTDSLVNKTTVYRNIDIFEEVGITNRVYSGWRYGIELSDKFKAHHHHMTCTSCGTIISFEESDSFTDELKIIEKKYNFKAKTHSLELKGLCKSCC